VATCCHIRLGYELLVHNIYKFDLYTVNWAALHLN
jgi:hypothetical protein